MAELGKDPRWYSIRSIRQSFFFEQVEVGKETPWNVTEKIDFLQSKHDSQRCCPDEEQTPGTCAVHSGRAGVHSGQLRPRRPPAWLAVFSREEVVERRRRRRAVAQRRRPNAVIRILSPVPLFKMIPYGQSCGMERGGMRHTNLAVGKHL